MKQVLKKLDARDIFLVVGLVSFIGGIAHFSAAVAAITFGVMCLFVALRPVPEDPARPAAGGRLRINERQS